MKIKHVGWQPGRWCDTCRIEHGPLYECEHYSPELLKELATQNEQYKRNLDDPVWCMSQGYDKEAVTIFRWLAGV